MTTYYVNLGASTNGGGASRGDPYNAMSALPTLVAGDVVEIEPGTAQTMSGSYTVSGSGSSAAAPITIRANPAVAGAKPQLKLSAQGANGLICTGRSYIRIENIRIVGDAAWTSQNSVGVVLNGGLTDVQLTGVELQYCRFDLVGGFASNGVRLIDCSAVDNPTDGLRWWSGANSYTWQNVQIVGGTYSRNGTAQGANGSGISMQVLAGHTGTIFANTTIRGLTIVGNYRHGIFAGDNSVAWATLTAAANTTPPTRQIRGIEIGSNVITGNGGAGISLSGAQPDALPVRVWRNLCEENSARTTLGNIWTGGCLKPLIERNVCRRAYSNGTVVGDGQGVFDDQWNDQAVVRWNLIENNIFQAGNPEFTSYGIGIYRSSNGKHYGNVIRGCRYGFLVGYVATATAPVMAGISIHNNTIDSTTKSAVVAWADTPAGAFSFRNNLIVGALQDIEAQSGNAGNQTWAGNAAIGVTTKYTGNNVGAGAVDHTLADAADIAPTLRPVPGSPLIAGGADLGYVRDIQGRQCRRHVGAFGPAMLRAAA